MSAVTDLFSSTLSRSLNPQHSTIPPSRAEHAKGGKKKIPQRIFLFAYPQVPMPFIGIDRPDLIGVRRFHGKGSIFVLKLYGHLPLIASLLKNNQRTLPSRNTCPDQGEIT
jgi:hypothetical protein